MQWLDAAGNALVATPSGLQQLLTKDGLLAKLAARGYEVIEP